MIETKLGDAFCVLPFKHMQIGNNGFVRLCCQTPWLKDDAGKPITVYEHSAAEIWNSKAMREIRRAMIEGKQVTECSKCWQQELHGGFSGRMSANANANANANIVGGLKEKLLNLLKQSINPLQEIKLEAVRENFFVHSSPVDIELEVGNVCNLMCRMCSPTYSSKIEHDPVHSKWHNSLSADSSQEKLKPNVYPLSRLPEKKHWFKEKAFIYKELLSQPKSIRVITFKGGEPFLSKEAVGILDYLSTEGDPRKTQVAIVTNGTIADSNLLNIISRFDSVHIAVSLDGVGSYYEYIRYPAKWSTVEANLRTFAELSNVLLMTSITFQAYNAMQIVKLFRFCDRFGYEINVNALDYPSYLAASVIPPKARQMAVKRIRDYVATDCKQKNQATISALASGLEALGDQIDMENLNKFMLFTNDLDQSRNQHFSEVQAELLGYIEEAGIPWNEETRFARQDPLTPVLNSTLTMTEV